MRRVLILVALMLTGCVTASTLTGEGQTVRVVSETDSSLQGCTPVRVFTVTAGALTLGEDNNITDLRNQAATVGANALTYTEIWAGPFAVSSGHGTAYRCP